MMCFPSNHHLNGADLSPTYIVRVCLCPASKSKYVTWMYSGLIACKTVCATSSVIPLKPTWIFLFWAILFLCMRASSVLVCINTWLFIHVSATLHYRLAYLFTYIRLMVRTLGEIISFHSLRSAPERTLYVLRFGLRLQTAFPLNSALIIHDYLTDSSWTAINPLRIEYTD